MLPRTCPSEQQIQAFQFGDLTEPSLTDVAEHLETCPWCESVAQRLDTILDPVLAAIREACPLMTQGGAVNSAASFPIPLHWPETDVPTSEYPFLRPPEAPDELGRIGGYRVLRLLGQGGMSYVFLAEDVSLQRPVALKIMKAELRSDPEGQQRFLREARIMASIKDDNLVTVYQVGQEGPVVYLAMDVLEGESLDDRLERVCLIDVPTILRLAREIAQGLAVVHARGLIHRDIKPANIWLESPTERVKILDFGLARFVNDDTQLTQTGTVMGTPSFMSPEQARGEKVDPRSDLFSLGSVLYTICTGVKPFGHENTMAVLTALAVRHPPDVRQMNPVIPHALSDLIMEMLSKNPADRPESAVVVVQRLRAIEADPRDRRKNPSSTKKCRVSGTPLRAGRGKKKQPRRRWMMVLAAVVVGLAAAVTGFAVTWGWNAPEPRSVYPVLPDRVYFNSLPVADSVNWPFDYLLFARPIWKESPNWPAPLGGVRVCVKGKVSPHGIWMHLPPTGRGVTSVSYRLGKQYRTFRTGVSLNDGPGRCTPLTFSVHGDGHILWQSDPVAIQEDEQSSPDISVKDVDKLTLEVNGSGSETGSHAVWIEPSLSNVP
jgi:serine/threonine protein kinase